MKQHKVAGLKPALWLRAAQQVLGRQALEHHGSTGLERDRIGQPAHAFGGHHAHLAVAARRLAGIGRAVAHFQMGHALAHGLNNARRLHAQLHRHGQLVQTAALVHVDEIQANGLMADANLTGTGFTDGDVNKLEFFGATVLVDANGFGGDGCHAGVLASQ